MHEYEVHIEIDQGNGRSFTIENLDRAAAIAKARELDRAGVFTQSGVTHKVVGVTVMGWEQESIDDAARTTTGTWVEVDWRQRSTP